MAIRAQVHSEHMVRRHQIGLDNSTAKAAIRGRGLDRQTIIVIQLLTCPFR